MNKETKAGQGKHDSSVLRSAEWYKNNGYRVSADLPNYDKPKKIGGFVPDLIARKGKKEIILEVETKKSNEIDKEQQDAFREYALKAGAEFRKKIV